MGPQCGNFRILLSLRFYVKSNLKNVKVQRMPSAKVNIQSPGPKSVKKADFALLQSIPKIDFT